jgi:16S rRNA (uracil1498-N3)-methyltransferase
MSAKHAHIDRRFLARGPLASGDTVALSPDESHHLTHVLRLGPGDRVAVFDGQGREFVAQVAATKRTGVTVRLLEPSQPAAEPDVPLTIVQAVLKGSSMDDVVRDATMIGASAIAPVLTTRVAVKPSAAGTAGTVERWNRVALASAKQCRRAVLPAVAAPVAFADWLRTNDHDLRLILVEPAAGGGTTLRDLLQRTKPRTVAVIVGPEGGWSPDEVAAARDHGCLPVSLGSLTLRADAVAAIAGSLVRLIWEN